MFLVAKKTRKSSEISTRKIVAGEHLNPNGTLFGGYLMCWLDEVAFMCAQKYSGQSGCVTASIDNITFKTPIRMGEHVVLTAFVNAVGHSSMEIEVQIEKEDHVTGKREYTHSAHLTFVCLNEKQRPTSVPRLELEDDRDVTKNQEFQLRAKVRKRLKKFLDAKVQHLHTGRSRRRGMMSAVPFPMSMFKKYSMDMQTWAEGLKKEVNVRELSRRISGIF